jgi:hypothetical protein
MSYARLQSATTDVPSNSGFERFSSAPEQINRRPPAGDAISSFFAIFREFPVFQLSTRVIRDLPGVCAGILMTARRLLEIAFNFLRNP